jgi:hypothetical protein
MKTFEDILGFYRSIYSSGTHSKTTDHIQLDDFETVEDQLNHIILPSPHNHTEVYNGKTYSVDDSLLSLEEVINLDHGTKVWCNLRKSFGKWCIGTIVKDFDSFGEECNYIITDVYAFQGKKTRLKYDQYGQFSWIVKEIGDLGIGVKIATELGNVNPINKPKKYTKREGYSGIAARQLSNLNLFDNLGIQVVTLSRLKVKTNLLLTYDKPNVGDSLVILKEVKGSTENDNPPDYYCLVEFGDNKFCVINSKNIQ